MKKILIISFIIFGVYSCSSEFNNIEQARNEVNKEGYRDGRWVDYYDSTGSIVEDKTNGYKFYVLSEYEEGKLIGETKSFDNKGTLLQRCIPYEDLNPKFEKKLSQSIKYMKMTWYDSKGNIERESVYNKNGDVVNEKGYVRIKDKDLMVSSKKIIYYEKGKSKIEEGFLILPPNINKKHFYHIEYKKESDYSSVSKLESVKKSVKEKILDMSRDNDILFSLAYSDNFIESNPYRIDHISVDSDTIQIGEIITHSINQYKSSKTSEGNGGTGEMVRCYYCNNTFSKQNGYVYGYEIGCIKKYSTAMFEISVAKSVGYPQSKLNILYRAYNNGHFLCSRRCSDYSGFNYCPE